MVYEEMYLNLTYNQKVVFAICVIAFVLICIIVTKMKNKTKKTIRQQIIPHTINFDLYKYIVENKEVEFIGQNKVYENEIKRNVKEN